MIEVKFVPSTAPYPAKPKKRMVFTPNPLALSVPEPEFESWLRDSGYLEIIDQRTTDLHRLSTNAPNPAAVDTTSAAATNSSSPTEGFLHSLFSLIWTLLSLFTFNPFSKLTTDDFSGDTPPWTAAFFGFSDSYSFPSSPAQVRLRVHENVKRFARNYASLFILLFACSLYQLPIALVGLISCLALWDVFKFAGDRWNLDGCPVLRELLIRIVQCVTVVIMLISNVQLAVFYAVGFSYAVMMLHSSFRKLTLAKQPAAKGRNRRIGRR
ncbi:PRA1 family protein H [Primulina huaijiensis]|uniref:PRA1 family protein H n=1 Tax=Primulina huaijiensis TaxID=1492673 RepID=UPI003CC7141C